MLPKQPSRGPKDPSNKRLPKHRHRKRPKGAKGNGWALLSIAGSLAAMWAFAIFRLNKKKQTERTLLSSMLAKPMMITDHAACRMGCRFVSQGEVREALQNGDINARKSNPFTSPCPKYVVDARVGKGKTIQAVFSACRDTTKLVTVIDQDTDWDCYCP